jgi:predicted amidohydrolase
MTGLRVSLLQYNIFWESPSDNYKRILELLGSEPESDLILFPEMFNTGFCVSNPEQAEEMSGPSVDFLWKLSSKSKSLIAGSLMIREEGKIYNRLLVLQQDKILAQYDKMHLFKLSHEHKHFTPGTERTEFVWNNVRFRLITCYDLRFPYLAYNDSNYDVLLVSANWPFARINHWEALLRARAIENQAFVVGVNRVGIDPEGIEYPGHSVVYDFNGDCLLKFTGEHLRTQSLDLEAIYLFRKKLPFLSDQMR